MPKIITFISPKGGSGATFCLSGIWRCLADNSIRVLGVDACFDKCALDSALDFKNDYIYTMSDVTEGNCTFEDAVSTFGGGSFVRLDYDVPSHGIGDAFEIIKKSDYDYVLVDLSDRSEAAVRDVLSFTDTLVCVTEPSQISAEFCAKFLQTADFDNSYILVNKIIPTYIKNKIHLTIDEISDETSCPLIGLVPWSPEAEILLKEGMKGNIEDRLLKDALSNTAERITGKTKPACDFKKIYDCFKIKKQKI